MFDKTGTLTEDGLDLKFVLPVNSQSSLFGSLVEDSKTLCKNNMLLRGMASCHSLTYIHGVLAGDPLDLKMFEFTNWDFVEFSASETENFDRISPAVVRPRIESVSENDDENLMDSQKNEKISEIGIIRQFPFSSSLKRMSMVVKGLDSPHFELFTKGAPEKICELSRKETSNLFIEMPNLK